MWKQLFLEYKFGDYNIETLEKAGASGLIVWIGNLTPECWRKLTKLEISLGICIAGTQDGVCPLDPRERSNLEKRIEAVLSYNPESIWIDHIRFDGYWEGIKDGVIPDMHTPCSHCQRANRVEVIDKIAGFIRLRIPPGIKLGYFAVPFKPEEVPALVSVLGQDHEILAKHFDLISPMLYHRMIGRPVNYISDYVSYLYKLIGKPILPIIQVKDMPDNLPDELDEEEMIKAYKRASKFPSAGVAWFSWDSAVEKGKTQVISKMFSSIII